jgi:hypothetical protein
MFRMNSWSAAPVACVIAALTTVAGRAHALSCAEPGVSVPYADAVQVPTNTLVWCTKRADSPLSTIRLRDAEGADVSGTQTQMTMQGYDILVYHPDAELAANSQYTVDCPRRYDEQPSTRFTTGSGPRVTPPAVPDVSSVEGSVHPDSGWGASHYVLFRQASEADTIVVVDVAAGSSSLNPDAPSGAVSDALYSFQASDIYVGNGPCRGSWPGATLGASTRVALGAFDLTGAFSGWSDEVTVTLPSEYPVSEEVEAAPVGDGEPQPDENGPAGGDEVGDPEPDDDGSSESTGVSETPPPDARGDFVATDAAGDVPVRPSPMGRSGCALGARQSSLGVGAGLLLALAGLVARRRRSSR